MRGSNSRASTERMTVTARSDSACASAGIEGDQLRIEPHCVAVERDEQRVLDRQIGHVDLDLRPIDRLRALDAALHGVLPGRGRQRLVLEQDRVGHAEIGTSRRSRRRCVRGTSRRRWQSRTAIRRAYDCAGRSQRAAASGSSCLRSGGRLRTRAGCVRRTRHPDRLACRRTRKQSRRAHGSPMRDAPR